MTVYTNLSKTPIVGKKRGPKPDPSKPIEIYQLIVERAEATGFCTLSNPEFAAVLGLNRGRCSKLLTRLRRAGYVRLEFFHGYTVDDHWRVVPQHRRVWPLVSVECVEALERELAQ